MYLWARALTSKLANKGRFAGSAKDRRDGYVLCVCAYPVDLSGSVLSCGGLFKSLGTRPRDGWGPTVFVYWVECLDACLMFINTYHIRIDALT